MLNSYNNTNNYNKTYVSNHVNAVTGNITKTYRKSFFSRFHLQSDFSNKLMCDKPKMMTKVDYVSKWVDIVVVQMVVVGDMEVIAELMFKSDYDEMLDIGEEK